MPATITTHLNFRGQARAALQFYRSVFGGDMTASTYSDVGMPADAPGADHLVFGQLTAEPGLRLMAYDVPGPASAPGEARATRRENGVTITDEPSFLVLGVDTLAEAEQYWSAMSADAVIIERLAASPWSAGFGMLTDRFGVTWIVQVSAVPATPSR